jgi:hypothetical protein
MVYIAGTGVPVTAYSSCPRCHFRWQFTAFSLETQYRCSGCEWAFSFGAGASPLSTNGSVTTASLALPFASGATVFATGNVLFINDGASSEIVIVNGTVTGTSVPVADLDFSHGSAVAVSLAVATPQLTSVQTVPANPGWGF